MSAAMQTPVTVPEPEVKLGSLVKIVKKGNHRRKRKVVIGTVRSVDFSAGLDGSRLVFMVAEPGRRFLQPYKREDLEPVRDEQSGLIALPLWGKVEVTPADGTATFVARIQKIHRTQEGAKLLSISYTVERLDNGQHMVGLLPQQLKLV